MEEQWRHREDTPARDRAEGRRPIAPSLDRRSIDEPMSVAPREDLESAVAFIAVVEVETQGFDLLEA